MTILRRPRLPRRPTTPFPFAAISTLASMGGLGGILWYVRLSSADEIRNGAQPPDRRGDWTRAALLHRMSLVMALLRHH